MRISNLFAVMIATMVHATAGEPLTFLRHSAVGWGTAQVFDGGPTVSDSGGTEDSDDSSMSFLAVDFTPGGSFGARASAAGRSSIASFEQSMGIVVDFVSKYSPSVFPGGDNPGGMAEGRIDSVIEFVMPVDELEWIYALRVEPEAPFQGFAQAVFQNLTTGEVLFDLTEPTAVLDATLRASTGDVMRLTTNLSGFGSMGPGSGREFDSQVRMILTIPEPSSLLLLAAGAATVLRRNRPHERACLLKF